MSDLTESISNTISNLAVTYSTGTLNVGSGGGSIVNVTIPGLQSYLNAFYELNPPTAPPGSYTYQPGTQSISPLARGVVNNSSISLNNSNLFHNCGFLANINTDLSSIIASINAIRHPPKNALAIIIRFGIPNIMNIFRAALDAILKALNFDPSGELSAAYSTLKYYLRKIARLLKLVAKLVALANAVISIQENLTALINYIKSLPAQIASIFQNCLNQFLGSVTQLVTNIQNIAGTSKNSTVSQSLSSIIATANSAVTSANSQSGSASANANVSSVLTNVLMNPSLGAANGLVFYISSTTPSSNSIKSQTYSSANTQSP
jgi:hypothetical protein